jgi:succinate-semialdehyde dehydrogenase/glutarate-semialdehyde dehydrogenase
MPAMAEFVEDATSRGARVEMGGSRIGSSGNFWSPTVLTNVHEDSKVMKLEPFGPIAPCVPFKDLDDTIRRANALPYGLSSYAFTGSTKNALRLQNGLESGLVNINHFGQGLPESPFGGIKDSGIGSEGGTETFDGYLNTKFVTQLTSALNFWVKRSDTSFNHDPPTQQPEYGAAIGDDSHEHF